MVVWKVAIGMVTVGGVGRRIDVSFSFLVACVVWFWLVRVKMTGAKGDTDSKRKKEQREQGNKTTNKRGTAC